MDGPLGNLYTLKDRQAQEGMIIEGPSFLVTILCYARNKVMTHLEIQKPYKIMQFLKYGVFIFFWNFDIFVNKFWNFLHI